MHDFRAEIAPDRTMAGKNGLPGCASKEGFGEPGQGNSGNSL